MGSSVSGRSDNDESRPPSTHDGKGRAAYGVRVNWLRGMLQERRHRQAARDALCAHDGTEPMCRDCHDEHMSTI